MARGDLTLFDEFAQQLGQEDHQFESDTFKLGLINSTVPTASDSAPSWEDYSSDEVSTSGGYTADGITLTSTFTYTGGVATFDASDVQLSQNGSGFTDAYWGIIYNWTQGGTIGEAIAFLDLGGPVSEQDGPVNINWNANGIFTIAVTP